MTTKTEVLDRISAGRVQITAQWVGLTEDEMIRPGMHGGWSVKDLIAHLIFWEQRMLDRTPGLLDGQRFPPAELDELNAQVYAANRDRPLAELRAKFRALFPRIVALVKDLPDSALDRPIDALGGAALWEFIAGNSSGHYEEHMDAIQAWSAQLKAERALASPRRSSLALVRQGASRRKRAREEGAITVRIWPRPSR